MNELIEIKLVNGRHELTYLNSKYCFCISVCTKERSSIEEEVEQLSARYNLVQAIIPERLVRTPLQFIQAVLNYYLYGEELGVKNKGLLLSMFVIGEDQISEAVNVLRREYVESSKYFLLALDCNCESALHENCAPYVIDSLSQEQIRCESTVKNLAKLLKRL